MSQTIKGAFSLTLRGIPFLMTGRLRLKSEKGSSAGGRAIIIGPFIIGVISRG